MSVRTYNPSVRVGNWNEDLCLEEDLLKDFIDKKEKKELLIYKAHNLSSKILQPVDLSNPKDGLLHFGDTICLYHPTNEENLVINMSDSCLHVDETVSAPCGVSASKILQPCYRNAFVITSCDGSDQLGDYLTFGKQFMISTLPGIGGELKLISDRATFMKSAKKSRFNDVALTSTSSYLCHWQILHSDPQQRLETEGMPVPANQKVNINHCKTNERLSAMAEYRFRTPFGWEHEVAAHTFLDSHKAEKQENHWCLVACGESEVNK